MSDNTLNPMESKKAEEIKTLDELIIEFNSKPYGVSLERFIYSYFAIHIKAQQLKEYREVIRELLPYVENAYKKETEYNGTLAKIGRARKLIDQTDSSK